MVNREVIGAHYGWRDWLGQRVTAVVMLCYTIFLVSVLIKLPALDYQHWRVLWDMPLLRYSTFLFILATLFHAWVGVRNIFMDYIKDTGVRLILYVAVILVLIAYAAWAVQILWSR